MPDESKLFHQRLRRAKGPASGHKCVVCGKDGYDWAYQHSDPYPLEDNKGYLYSLDSDHYKPMCRSCHKKLDYRMHPAGKIHLDSVRHLGIGDSDEMSRRSGMAKKVGRPLTRSDAQDLGRLGGTARASRMKSDQVLRERMAEVARKTAIEVSKVQRECTCGKISTPAGIGNHQKVSGHSGYSDRKG